MGQSNPYSYALLGDAVNALNLRLNDPGFVHWTQAELILYINEALRVWNCLTNQWAQDWNATYDNTALAWQSTANPGNLDNPLIGANPTSPRDQQLTDTYCYTLAQYHLLEPPTGGLWTGTSQFQISDFSQALQRRRDYVLQMAACNIAPIAPITLPPGQNRIFLPDVATQSVLDVRRVRFIPTSGSPTTLYRDDGLAMEYFAPFFPITNAIPTTWDVIAGPPLALTFDAAPSTPNTLDILSIISAGTISPPSPDSLYIPDDYYWVLKFGMMADVLRKESESTDLARAAYCEQRFIEGLRMMMEMPWLLQARINGVPVDTPSVIDADAFDNEWQSNPNAQPGIVVGGIDLFAVSPQPSFLPSGTQVSVTLTLIGSTPITSDTTKPIQVSRDVLNLILDEAEHLAQFKHGGSEFSNSLTLHQNFIRAAVKTNSRLMESGIFASTLRPVDSKLTAIDPRFALEAQ